MIQHLTLDKVIEHLKNLGCTWVDFSNYWDGAGWIVNDEGRATGLVRFHIDYLPTGEYYPEDHPYFAGMQVHQSSYEGFSVMEDVEEYWGTYYPGCTMAIFRVMPIDEAVSWWRARTAYIYEQDGLKQP